MVNPWLRLPTKPPYVLRLEEDLLHELYDTPVPDEQLRLDCLPGPFMGSRDAPIVLLNLKPGFDPRDIEAEKDPAFFAGAWATLRGDPQPYPAFLFDPRFRETPGG